jgi:hypothetical protein
MNRAFARLLAGLLVLLLGAHLSHPLAATPQGKDVKITKNDQTENIECKGNDVTVKGSDNRLVLKGQCDKLTVSGDDNVITAATVKEVTVSGDDNKITVESVAKITTTGDDNVISWTSGSGGKGPAVSSKGEDNQILQRKP